MNIKYQIQKDTLSQILGFYGILDFEFQEAEGGVANTTVFVSTNNQSFVLRVYRLNTQTDEEIFEEIEFLNFLKSKNLLVPNILPNSGGDYLTKVILSGIEWQVVLMPRIKGKTITNSQWLDPDFIKQIGIIQAQLHLAGVEFALVKSKLEYNRDLTAGGLGKMLKERLVEAKSLGLQDENLLKILNGIQSLGQKYQPNLPAGYIHDDISGENLLIDDQKGIYVIDFGDLRFGPLVSCLGSILFVTLRIGYLGSQNTQELFNQYLLSYETIRVLTNEEMVEIKKVMIMNLELFVVSEILNSKIITSYLEKLTNLKKKILKLKIKNKNL